MFTILYILSSIDYNELYQKNWFLKKSLSIRCGIWDYKCRERLLVYTYIYIIYNILYSIIYIIIYDVIWNIMFG